MQAIIDRTIAGVEAGNPERSGNVILLHDAGGNRAETVAALPIIIERLRAMGYSFVPVSTLAGLSRNQSMPVISSSDRVAAVADLALFSTLGGIVVALRWIFGIAITIGIIRALALSALALIQARRELKTVFPAIDPVALRHRDDPRVQRGARDRPRRGGCAGIERRRDRGDRDR